MNQEPQNTPAPKERRRWPFVLAIAVIILLAGTFAVLQAMPTPKAGKRSEPRVQATTTTKPKPVTAPCPLTGVDVRPDLATRQPLAVVIENSPKARPQSGLSQADLVFEVVAEGGVTRFLAVYLHGESSKVGPVRSVREYFADLASAYGAALSHCGGSPTGYATIRRLGVDDLDQFVNDSSYWRERGRRAPHNLYSSTAKLRELMQAKGYRPDGGLKSMAFKDDAPPGERPPSATVDVDFSERSYHVRWIYQPSTNSYLRLLAGKAHRDALTGDQLSARNIVVIFTGISALDNKGRVRVDLNGRGRALFFRDGQSEEGAWERFLPGSQIDFSTADGQPVTFNRGATWVEILANGRAVSFNTTATTTTSP